MLRELKNLENPGSKMDILYFLQSVVGQELRRIDDIYTLCAHPPAGYMLSCSALISYCENFGWILTDSKNMMIESTLRDFLGNKEELNQELIRRTIKILFEEKILTSDMFSYDVMDDKIEFHNEYLPLAYSTIRNTLINQGFLITRFEGYNKKFYVDDIFETVVSSLIKKTKNLFTIDQLREKLKKDEITGEMAENYVLSFEKKRISNPALNEKIRAISDIDVTAGYDVLSFESDFSHVYDRYIEVKALSSNGFYWSSNEFNIAKLKGTQYYLYLVNLSKIKEVDYIPIMICNPAKELCESRNWIVETDSFHIRHIE